MQIGCVEVCDVSRTGEASTLLGSVIDWTRCVGGAYVTPTQQNDLYQPAVFVYTAAPPEAEHQRNGGQKTKQEAMSTQPEVTQSMDNVFSVQLKGVKRSVIHYSLFIGNDVI